MFSRSIPLSKYPAKFTKKHMLTAKAQNSLCPMLTLCIYVCSVLKNQAYVDSCASSHHRHKYVWVLSTVVVFLGWLKCISVRIVLPLEGWSGPDSSQWSWQEIWINSLANECLVFLLESFGCDFSRDLNFDEFSKTFPLLLLGFISIITQSFYFP